MRTEMLATNGAELFEEVAFCATTFSIPHIVNQ
jgi:hypothetical protein